MTNKDTACLTVYCLPAERVVRRFRGIGAGFGLLFSLGFFFVGILLGLNFLNRFWRGQVVSGSVCCLDVMPDEGVMEESTQGWVMLAAKPRIVKCSMHVFNALALPGPFAATKTIFITRIGAKTG